MKKKLTALALCASMIAVMVIGGTLAYFTDTDAQTNVFTVGNVKIDLWEDFGKNEGLEKLVPATGSAQDGTLRNGVEKEVYVENTGTEKAFVRVHIAIPSILDNAQPDFDASKNVLHFNGAKGTFVDGKWNWSTTLAGNDNLADGTMINGKSWNTYNIDIGPENEKKAYNVYVVTYESALERGDITVDAMSQVYLDSKTSNEDINKIKEVLGNEWKIYVVAEAGQADGFDDAFTALNTQFGDPATGYKADFTKVAEEKMFVEGENAALNDGTNSTALLNTVAAKGQLANANFDVSGTTVTITVDENISVKKVKNPADVEAYWVGYLEFTAPAYVTDINQVSVKFTRDGEVKDFAPDTTDGRTMQAWIAADVDDKDALRTYSFDWDGDGIYDAVYQLKVTNITIEKPEGATNP